jgi:hypothetical protein
MKALSTFITALFIAGGRVGEGADVRVTKPADIHFPHEHVQMITMAEADIPYEKKLLMKEHDAVIFILPGQKPVSVWCYKPEDRFPLAEQETKSGLKTSWGEKPWIKPRMKWKSLGRNSDTGDGWDTYIEMGGVVTTGDRQSDYTLYVDALKFSIIEDLSATNALPVTIRVTRTNRQPQVGPAPLTGASRFAQRRVQRHRRLAPVADLSR